MPVAAHGAVTSAREMVATLSGWESSPKTTEVALVLLRPRSEHAWSIATSWPVSTPEADTSRTRITSAHSPSSRCTPP